MNPKQELWLAGLSLEDIHRHYQEILSTVPALMYWIDKDCNLQGCNKSFIQFFNVKAMTDFAKTPYDIMKNANTWSDKQIDALRLDDMKVLFSQQSQQHKDMELGMEAPYQYFSIHRVPLLNNKEVIGVAVALSDVTLIKGLQQTEHSAAVAEKSEEIAVADHELHVLMVEDNKIAQQIEEELFRSLHCQVDIADSEETAIQLFNPGKYDMVLMDIGLKDTSGYMVAKRLRQKEEKTSFHVPIIALTSYNADVVQYDVKDYCMDGVISKPITSHQAQQMIQKFILHQNISVDGLRI